MQNLSFSVHRMTFEGEKFGGLSQPETQNAWSLTFPAAKDFTIAFMVIRYRCTLKGVGYNCLFEIVSDSCYLFNTKTPIDEAVIYEAYKDIVSKTQEYVNNNRGHIDGGAIGLFAMTAEAMDSDIKQRLQEARQTAYQWFHT